MNEAPAGRQHARDLGGRRLRVCDGVENAQRQDGAARPRRERQRLRGGTHDDRIRRAPAQSASRGVRRLAVNDARTQRGRQPAPQLARARADLQNGSVAGGRKPRQQIAGDRRQRPRVGRARRRSSRSSDAWSGEFGAMARARPMLSYGRNGGGVQGVDRDGGRAWHDRGCGSCACASGRAGARGSPSRSGRCARVTSVSPARRRCPVRRALRGVIASRRTTRVRDRSGRPRCRRGTLSRLPPATVTPHEPDSRATGIVLMPVGIASAGAGLVMLWWAGLQSSSRGWQGCNGGRAAGRATGLWIPPG